MLRLQGFLFVSLAFLALTATTLSPAQAGTSDLWDAATVEVPVGYELRATTHRDTGQEAYMITRQGARRLWDPRAYAGVVRSAAEDSELSMRAYVRSTKVFYRSIDAVLRRGSEKWNADRTIWSAEYSIPGRRISRELIRVVQTPDGFVEAFAGVRSASTWRSTEFRKLLEAVRSVRPKE